MSTFICLGAQLLRQASRSFRVHSSVPLWMQSTVRVTPQIVSFFFHHDSSPNLGGGSAQIARTEQLSE